MKNRHGKETAYLTAEEYETYIQLHQKWEDYAMQIAVAYCRTLDQSKTYGRGVNYPDRVSNLFPDTVEAFEDHGPVGEMWSDSITIPIAYFLAETGPELFLQLDQKWEEKQKEQALIAKNFQYEQYLKLKAQFEEVINEWQR